MAAIPSSPQETRNAREKWMTGVFADFLHTSDNSRPHPDDNHSMKNRRLIFLALVLFVSMRPALAEPAPPEPGPENGGLRMRLTVLPKAEAGAEGYDVRDE